MDARTVSFAGLASGSSGARQRERAAGVRRGVEERILERFTAKMEGLALEGGIRHEKEDQEDSEDDQEAPVEGEVAYLAAVARTQSDPANALKHEQANERRARLAGDMARAGGALSNQSVALCHLKRASEAVKRAGQSCALFDALLEDRNDHVGRGFALSALAESLSAAGRWQESQAACGRARDVFTMHRALCAAAGCLSFMADQLEQRSLKDEAYSYRMKALRELQALVDDHSPDPVLRRTYAVALRKAAVADFCKKRYSEALRNYQRAAAESQKIGLTAEQAISWLGAGGCFVALQQFGPAPDAYLTALSFYLLLDNPQLARNISSCAFGAGLTYWHLHVYEGTQACMDFALRCYVNTKDRGGASKCLQALQDAKALAPGEPTPIFDWYLAGRKGAMPRPAEDKITGWVATFGSDRSQTCLTRCCDFPFAGKHQEGHKKKKKKAAVVEELVDEDDDGGAALERLLDEVD